MNAYPAPARVFTLAVAFLALVLALVPASPAAADLDDFDRHTGWAQVECGDGVVIVARINGRGGGKCKQAGHPWPPTILKKCADSPEGELECALVPVSDGAQVTSPPPPCWTVEGGNNCPVGGALTFAAPSFAMVGVPVTIYAYTSISPDPSLPAQPTNASAVIRVNGEDYSGVEFVDGVASWRFVPASPGEVTFTVSEVFFSNTSGASAYIDTVPASVTVLPYDPAAFEGDFDARSVAPGSRLTLASRDQLGSVAEDRYEFASSTAQVCAVYETKKGSVKAKFTDSGECRIVWTDTEGDSSGVFSFKVK